MFRRPLPLLSLGLLAACHTAQDDFSRAMLQPPPGWCAEPGDIGLAAEPFEIELHSEASLTGWWIPHTQPSGTVVLFHGERTNVSVLHPYYLFLHDAGFNVLVFDPRGYGKSKGTATLQAWIYDLPELFDWLRERPGVDMARLAFYGTGLGSTAAIWAARTQGNCVALVMEQLPSPRDIVAEGVGNEGSALGAFATGMVEYASVPEDIEPVDGAPRTKAPALFVMGENELLRDRRSLLRTFQAYAGDKRLWVLPGTRAAPHAFVTHDGEYQKQIAAFLKDAFAAKPPGVTAAVAKGAAAGDGQQWHEIQLAAPGPGDKLAVEACAALADGTSHFARTWLEQGKGSVRLKLPSPPLAAGAVAYSAAAADPEQVFRRPSTLLSRSAATIEPLWPRIEELRNGALPPSQRQQLAADLRAAEATEPFHPRLVSELADVWLLLGKDLYKSADATQRDEGARLLQRTIAAVPAQPSLHVWPGINTTYGFPQEAAVVEAKRLLAAPRD